MKLKLLVVMLGTASVAFAAYEQPSLSNLTGAENVGNPSGASSPSQVVILHNTPSQNQDQETGSYMDSRVRSKQKYNARAGWGTGESLDDIRQQRIDKEAKNEQVLMEKLEESRMEDERSRLRRLFKIREYNRKRRMELGEEDYAFGRAESDYETEDYYIDGEQRRQERVVNIIMPDSAKTPAPQPQEVVDTTTYSPSGKPAFEKKSFIKGQLGLGSYKASNTSMETSWGLSFGQDIDPRWYFELGAFKTNYKVEEPYNSGAATVTNYNYQTGRYESSRARSLDQYNFSGLLGLKLINTESLVGALRGGLSYVRRDSESADVPGLQSFRSNTVDGIIGASADLEVSTNIAVTGTMDYYTNLLNDIASTDSDTVERVETSDYFILGVGLKLKF